MPSVSLSFLNRKTVNKQVCRICREFAELKTERLCAVCSQDQSADPLALPAAVRRTMAIPAEQDATSCG